MKGGRSLIKIERKGRSLRICLSSSRGTGLVLDIYTGSGISFVVLAFNCSRDIKIKQLTNFNVLRPRIIGLFAGWFLG